MKVIKPGSTVLYPVPAVVVSCGLERPNLITLAWVGTVCSDPPSVSIAVRPERFSYNLLVEAGEFVVNLPYASQVDVVDYCGQVSGRDVDKWAACGLTPVAATKVRTPLIGEFPVALECRVTQQLALGAHDLFIGEVLAVQADETVLNKQGQLDPELAQPLAFGGGHYYKVGQKLGRYGDWRKGIERE
jgi:flavin reductase (DIM6/NTAB) family NADH-FMN oxidoreductase RutF